MPTLLAHPAPLAPPPTSSHSKMPPARGLIHRIIACLVLGIAFVVMASVFSPDRSKAGETSATGDKSIKDKFNGGGPRSIDSDSTNPHEGLRSLGTLESRGYTIQIYATAVGARYSVYETASGREMGALLTVEQVNQLLPDLQLPAADFSASDSASGQLMMSDPDALN